MTSNILPLLNELDRLRHEGLMASGEKPYEKWEAYEDKLIDSYPTLSSELRRAMKCIEEIGAMNPSHGDECIDIRWREQKEKILKDNGF